MSDSKTEFIPLDQNEGLLENEQQSHQSVNDGLGNSENNGVSLNITPSKSVRI